MDGHHWHELSERPSSQNPLTCGRWTHLSLPTAGLTWGRRLGAFHSDLNAGSAEVAPALPTLPHAHSPHSQRRAELGGGESSPQPSVQTQAESNTKLAACPGNRVLGPKQLLGAWRVTG